MRCPCRLKYSSRKAKLHWPLITLSKDHHFILVLHSVRDCSISAVTPLRILTTFRFCPLAVTSSSLMATWLMYNSLPLDLSFHQDIPTLSTPTLEPTSSSTPTQSHHSPAPIKAVPSSSSTTTTSSSHSHASGKKDKTVNLKFSTADRTILEELKANIRAREAQFSIKGVGSTVVGGGRCAGKKYHPYPKREVPYPRSYDREVVDL